MVFWGLETSRPIEAGKATPEAQLPIGDLLVKVFELVKHLLRVANEGELFPVQVGRRERLGSWLVLVGAPLGVATQLIGQAVGSLGPGLIGILVEIDPAAPRPRPPAATISSRHSP